jgi:hypothetical protein
MKTFQMLLLVGLLVGCTKKQTETEKPPDPPRQSTNPTVIAKPKPVDLTPINVDAFIKWASASGLDEREKIREEIKKSSQNTEVLKALIDRFEKVDTLDLSYSLVVLSLIGELQNPSSQKWLEKQINRPIPTVKETPHGGLNSGDVIEMISSKAVESLAYLKTNESDRATLNVIVKHPSKAVRAAAIDAYLFNHGDTDDIKAKLKQSVRKEDLIYLDRVRFLREKDAKTFNAKIDRFYEQHPNEKAEAPGEGTEKRTRPDTTKFVKPIAPPKFERKQ